MSVLCYLRLLLLRLLDHSLAFHGLIDTLVRSLHVLLLVDLDLCPKVRTLDLPHRRPSCPIVLTMSCPLIPEHIPRRLGYYATERASLSTEIQKRGEH